MFLARWSTLSAMRSATKERMARVARLPLEPFGARDVAHSPETRDRVQHETRERGARGVEPQLEQVVCEDARLGEVAHRVVQAVAREERHDAGICFGRGTQENAVDHAVRLEHLAVVGFGPTRAA